MSINDFRLYGSNKKAEGTIDLAVSAEADEEAVTEEEVTEEVEPLAEVIAAGEPLPVPTSSSKKDEIKDYLINEHGIDPDDLDLTKAELLALVDDLK